jgi:hypothetical protein
MLTHCTYLPLSPTETNTSGRVESQIFCTFRGLHNVLMFVVAGDALPASHLLWLDY